jgi:hypothetical protein
MKLRQQRTELHRSFCRLCDRATMTFPSAQLCLLACRAAHRGQTVPILVEQSQSVHQAVQIADGQRPTGRRNRLRDPSYE